MKICPSKADKQLLLCTKTAIIENIIRNADKDVLRIYFYPNKLYSVSKNTGLKCK